jgi:hypothetical protein
VTTFDRTFAKIRITATTIATRTSAVLATLRGLQTGDDAEADVEADKDVAIYGPIGLVARPPPPDATGGAEGFAIRRQDGFAPIALIDRRITAARGAIEEYVVSLAGYFGQHVTLEPGTPVGEVSTPGPKITITLGPVTCKIVLDNNRTVITGETRVTATDGNDAAALEVCLQPTAAKVAELVIAANAMAAFLNVAGTVTGANGALPTVGALSQGTSPALKATP